MCLSLALDDLVSEEMDEDVMTSELPCTLAIEDFTPSSPEDKKTEEVSFSSTFSYFCWSVCLPEQPKPYNWLHFPILCFSEQPQIEHLCLFSLQFQFKEIVLTEEEKRLLSKEGATIPTHMPLTKVIDAEKCLFTCRGA